MFAGRQVRRPDTSGTVSKESSSSVSDERSDSLHTPTGGKHRANLAQTAGDAEGDETEEKPAPDERGGTPWKKDGRQTISCAGR